MNLSEFVKTFGKDTERYLVVEERKKKFDVTIANIRLRNGEIAIVKHFSAPELKKVKSIFTRTFDKAVFAFASDSAATIQDTVKITVPDPHEPITEGELENLVFKALWEFLNRHRKFVSRKLNVSGSSLVLNDIQVRSVLLDSHHLFNPVGFSGREIAFVMRGTFMTQMIRLEMDTMERIGKISIIEEGSALISSLPGDHFLLAYVGEDKTNLFLKDGDREIFCDEIGWGSRNIEEGVSEALGVDYETANRIIRFHAEQRMSEAVGRHLRKLIAAGFDGFTEAAASGLDFKKVVFYFDSLLVDPEIFGKAVPGKLSRFDEEMARKNLSLGIGGGITFDLLQHQGTLALLLYSYYDQRYEFLNGMLKRRAGWLISNF